MESDTRPGFVMDSDSRGNRTFTAVTQATINSCFPCVHEQWAVVVMINYSTRKSYFWFIIVICEQLMVKCSHPGESGEISRELLLQGHWTPVFHLFRD